MVEMKKELPKREDVQVELTWDLESIFATNQAWEDEFQALKNEIPKVSVYQGKLGNSGQSLYELLALQDKLSSRFGKLYTYVHMRFDEDTKNELYQDMQQRAE